MNALTKDVSALLNATSYAGYTYAYPHKTAYRPLIPPVPLQTLWEAENRDALFLYLHVPFCEMRCGFCNLFTTANPKGDFTALYLQALRRQAGQVRDALGTAKFARFAIGGGTPTFLDTAQLEELFTLAAEQFGIDAARIPVSVETSPRTAEPEKLRLLRERGVDRISIGVQSFVEAEVAEVGRAQKNLWVGQALDRIRSAGFPTLNIDLIYGLPGQTVASWLCSLEIALRFVPEELFLYPLYVRPLTGLERRAGTRVEQKQNQPRQAEAQTGESAADALRLACYRAGRDLLLANGYTQVSMRMFARTSRTAASRSAASDSAQASKTVVAYCCQEDGMVGVGCGARSYTRGLHYASEYAVGANGVRAILRDYVTKPAEAFAVADYGAALDAEEQRRRYLIQSLLQVAGIDKIAYRQRFGTEALADFPELNALEASGLAVQNADCFRLTESGVERSDSIGPWLYSPTVRAQMQAYELH